MYQTSNLLITHPISTPTTITWQSPSNIALVKYWGKFGRQYPTNPSISFTLSKAVTTTSLEYAYKAAKDNTINLSFLFEGQSNPLFEQKMVKFLTSIIDIYPFLTQLNLTVNSSNSFPHSSGIASSASSMSALALCLCSLEKQLFGTLQNPKEFLQKASYLARLGSGSACRSVYPKIAMWGQTGVVADSTNDYAIPFGDSLHPIFTNYQDAILIVSKAEKAVSSRAGHALMNGNPYAPIRYQQANDNLATLLQVLKTGDLTKFIEIVEQEALTLHALMMTSTPSYLLMRPNTLAIIEKIRAFRNETNCPICFTLDAGPNVHVLYPASVKEQCEQFIKTTLVPLCEDEYWISDSMGNGAIADVRRKT